MVWRRRFGLGIAAAILGGIVAVPGVSAAAPQMEVAHDSGTFVLEDCGGGVILSESYDVRLMSTLFFDRDGTPIRLQVHVDSLGVITNTGSGNTYLDPTHFTNEILADGPTTFNGLVYHIIVRGTGPVVVDVGTITFDGQGNIIFEAAPHMVADGTAPDPCAVLV